MYTKKNTLLLENNTNVELDKMRSELVYHPKRNGMRIKNNYFDEMSYWMVPFTPPIELCNVFYTTINKPCTST
jgi:hypothetical protein